MILTSLLASAAIPLSCTPDPKRIDEVAKTILAAGGPGLAVGIAVGKRSITKGYGVSDIKRATPVTPHTPFPLASVTKQFTAVAILLLQEDGRLSLTDPLSRYVPAFPNGQNITIEQLLAHTSGLADYAEASGAAARKFRSNSTEEMAQWVATLPPRFAPGERWEYSNSNYALLGLIIERASGVSWPSFMNNRLFKPAGMKDTAFDAPATRSTAQASGYVRDRAATVGWRAVPPIDASLPGAAGGLRTTIADLLRWSQALHGGRILDRASYDRLVTPARLSDGRTTKFGMPAEWQAGLNADYALGLFVTPTVHGARLWHGGDIDGYRTWLAYYPRYRLTVTILGNAENVEIGEAQLEAAALAGCNAQGPAG